MYHHRPGISRSVREKRFNLLREKNRIEISAAAAGRPDADSLATGRDPGAEHVCKRYHLKQITRLIGIPVRMNRLGKVQGFYYNTTGI